MKEKGRFACNDCAILRKCKEPLVSRVLFFIGFISVITMRVVNLLMDINPLMAKVFWYVSIVGFFISFFCYCSYFARVY
ncbi:MAG: hypothetical protein WC300_05365 [Candidatus Omnitrophota bacterium]|jgi:hypothetical protein